MLGFNRYLMRCVLVGALIALAVGPIGGILVSVYQALFTGDRHAWGEALILLVMAPFAGACGGIGWGMVASGTDVKSLSGWRLYLTYLAAIEAYLLAISMSIVLLSAVAPSYVKELPATDARFHAGVLVYGFFLVTVVFGVIQPVGRLLGKLRRE